jgi:hypothetical protein
MTVLAAILECLSLTGGSPADIPGPSSRSTLPLLVVSSPDEKHHLPSPHKTDADLAAEFVSILRTAEKLGPSLHRRLHSAVGTTRTWTETLARAVLDGLVEIIREGGREKMGPAMAEALRRVEDEADAAFRFAGEHPAEVLAGLLVIVAVGVLAVMMAPWVVEALGFAELGPVEGSFAAWWEACYAGYIPRGSLFSYLQRLGMTWK